MLQRGSLLYILYISYIYSMHAMSIEFRKRTAFAGTEKHVNIVISNSGDRPIYEQIASQIRDAILSGDLGEGDALPSIRSLATDLRVSVITTKRSYTELESQGFIDTIPGKAASLRGVAAICCASNASVRLSGSWKRRCRRLGRRVFLYPMCMT